MCSGRSSVSVMARPRLRNAISWSRRDSVSKYQSVVSKISPSGQNVMVVPRSSVALAPDQRAHRLAELVGLPPDVAVPADLDLEPPGQGVDHRDADAVQAAGDRVGLAVELAARVQGGQHDLDRGPLLDRVLVDGDATAVVGTRTPPSASSVTSMVSDYPASASSTALSTTSWTRWCRPRSPVEPMYMPGRLRTASRPSRTVIERAS